MKKSMLLLLLFFASCSNKELKKKQFKPTLALNQVKVYSDKEGTKSNGHLYDFTIEAYTQTPNYCFYIAFIECTKSEKPKVLELKQFGFGSTSELVNEN